jgi:hypothetical protein
MPLSKAQHDRIDALWDDLKRKEQDILKESVGLFLKWLKDVAWSLWDAVKDWIRRNWDDFLYGL